MLVISKEIMDKEKVKKGNILVSYIKDDFAMVYEKIILPFEQNGYRVVPVEKTVEKCREYFYHESTRKLIEQASCGVFAFSPLFNRKEYLPCMQAFFYEIGIMESKGIKVFPFILESPGEDSMRNFLQDKPIAYVQGASNAEDLLKSVRKLNLAIELYFKNPDIDRYVIRHIKHVRITAIMNIRRNTLRGIWENPSWNKDQDQGEDYVKSMTDALFEDLKTGATVMRFGKQEVLGHPAYMPYVSEGGMIYFNSPAQYDKTTKPKPVNENECANAEQTENEVVTTIRMEFTIPVHEILGTTFKPFLSLSLRSIWKLEHIMELVHADNEAGGLFDPDTIKAFRDKNENKIYFLLPLDKNKCVVDAGEEASGRYGRQSNFIFPK